MLLSEVRSRRDEEIDGLKSLCKGLEDKAIRLSQRNQDLVEAYWPIMRKLKSVETVK